MLDKLKKLLGIGPPTDYMELLKRGGQIIDVRTRAEFSQGHITGTLNISLDQLEGNLSKIKKDKPVITCCASGMRSASAKSILQSRGYKDVHNGGGWMRLQGKLK